MDPIFKWVTRGNAKKNIMMPKLPSIKLDKLVKLDGFDDVLGRLVEYVKLLLIFIVVFVIVAAGCCSFINV
jgi:hypothetical protein